MKQGIEIRSSVFGRIFCKFLELFFDYACLIKHLSGGILRSRSLGSYRRT